MIAEVLTDIGLSPTESKVYVSLVSSGPNPATVISRDTGIHRANVYSSLHRLSNRGLVTLSKIDKHVLFSANDPEALLSIVKEKEDSVRNILPQLVLQSSLTNSLDIEIISGLSGSINLLFSLQNLFGDFFFIGSEDNLPIGLSAKLSLLFSQSDLIMKNSSSGVLIFFRQDIVLFIFTEEMKTLKIKSKELVEVFKLLYF